MKKLINQKKGKGVVIDAFDGTSRKKGLEPIKPVLETSALPIKLFSSV